MARPERCPANTVVLGYASLADGEIPALAEALRTARSGEPVSAGVRQPLRGSGRSRAR